MNPIRHATLLLLCLASPLAAEDKKEAPASARWEKNIAAFEAEDRNSPPPKNAILFVGSSSIRMWDLKKSFPDLKTINRGFGGSQIEDSIHFADRIIIPHKPKQIVLYAGDNDIAKGKTAEQVVADYMKFVETVRGALPDVPVAFVPIKPSIARWNLWPEMKKANDAIHAHTKTDASLTYIDIVTPMLENADGTPQKDIFMKDGLHLNEKGYELWNRILRETLKLPTPK